MKLTALLPLTLLMLVNVTGCNNSAHTHRWENIAKREYYVSRASYTHGTEYFKSCSCGEVSRETFYDEDKLTYTVVGEPETKDKAGMVDLVGKEVAILIPDGTIFKKYKINYETYDLKNERIKESAAIIIPYDETSKPKFSKFVIDHHPTITDKNLAPTKTWTQMVVTSIARAAVLQCDLLGLGDTEDKIDDYHCHALTNRNSVDGILMAQQFLLDKCNVNIANLNTFSVGYSQGGYNSLSFMRYMEQEANEEERNVIHLEHTFAGSGAYDVQLLFDTVLADTNYDYTECVLLGLMAYHEYHPECFNNLTVNDYLASTGKELYRILNLKSDEELKNFKDNNSHKPADIFIPEFLNNKESEYYKAVKRCTDLENLLDNKWKPAGKLNFYYLKNDKVVTPKCSEKAIEIFKDLTNVDVYYDEEASTHLIGATTFYTNVLKVIVR